MVSIASFNYQKAYINYNSNFIFGLPAKYSSETNDDKQLKQKAIFIANGRIARYDTKNLFGQKDGKMSFEEYLSEQIYNLKVSTKNGSLSEDEKTMMKEDFNSLDINSDGLLDSKELANEILTMDNLGNKDGIITSNENEALWDGEKNTPEKIRQLLVNNYNKYFK